MRKTILQQKNYTTGAGNFQLKLPINYEVIMPENDPVRLLSLIMEELDYSGLYRAYPREGGKPGNRA
jgi:transposase